MPTYRSSKKDCLYDESELIKGAYYVSYAQGTISYHCYLGKREILQVAGKKPGNIEYISGLYGAQVCNDPALRFRSQQEFESTVKPGDAVILRRSPLTPTSATFSFLIYQGTAPHSNGYSFKLIHNNCDRKLVSAHLPLPYKRCTDLLSTDVLLLKILMGHLYDQSIDYGDPPQIRPDFSGSEHLKTNQSDEEECPECKGDPNYFYEPFFEPGVLKRACSTCKGNAILASTNELRI